MDRAEELQKLNDLKTKGVISDTEFANQKERILNMAYGPGDVPKPQFFFDGDAGSYLGTNILAAIITLITFGIAAPWAVCMREQWKATHTFVEGRKCKFIGTGADLFGKWIVWLILCYVTLGIYGFWVGPNLMKWKWANTRFE